LSFLRQDSVASVVGFLVLYKMADALMFSMSPVFLGRELGIGTDLRGIIRIFSVVASILGAIVGGAWIARRGLEKTLVLITFLMASTEPLFAILATFAPALTIFNGQQAATLETANWGSDATTLGLVTLVIVIEQICGGFATAAQVVFIMRRCHIEHKTAHFAFSTAIISLTHMGLGTMSGVVYEQVGSISYFWIVSALTLPAVFLAFIVPVQARSTAHA
jgi:PAT family beta-lactamase induction signal transducer AmpG